jgi:hypothetical protein
VRYFENASENGWRIEATGTSVSTVRSSGSHLEQLATETEAQQLLARRVQRKRADGYLELVIEPGAFIGGVRWNDGPRGPGWIRLQDGRDVHCSIESVRVPEVKIGLRVLVRELTPVFTLAMQRRRGPAKSCAASQCAPLPTALAAKLEALLDAELAQVPAQ